MGRTFKRCGCRGSDGKQLGARCPQLRDRNHGTWSFAVEVPSSGRARQVKRGGYPTRTEALIGLERLMGQVQQGVRVNDRITVGDWLDLWLIEKDQGLGWQCRR